MTRHIWQFVATININTATTFTR